MSTLTHKTFDELASGDRVETWDGIFGTVTAVEFVPTVIHDGSTTSFEAKVTIHAEHLPSFGAHGWPTSFEGDITRTVRKHGSDLRWHYTVETS